MDRSAEERMCEYDLFAGIRAKRAEKIPAVDTSDPVFNTRKNVSLRLDLTDSRMRDIKEIPSAAGGTDKIRKKCTVIDIDFSS